MEEQRPVLCRLCHATYQDSLEHNYSKRHRCNLYLKQWEEYRKGMAKSREGVEIMVTLMEHSIQDLQYQEIKRKGACITQLSMASFQKLDCTVTYTFTVKNARTTKICLVDVYPLHPVSWFKMFDEQNLILEGKKPNLLPGGEYKVKLQLKLQQPWIGTFKMPIVFLLQSFKEDKIRKTVATNQLTIAKEMVVHIGERNLPQEFEPSPFTGKRWDKNIVIFSPKNVTGRYGDNHSIPNHFYMPISIGLQYYDWLTPDEKGALAFLQEILDGSYDVDLQRHILKFNNYGMHSHILIWLEETVVENNLQNYNMEAVDAFLVCGNIVKLKVPGLAEKRPSIIVGDLVTIKVHLGNIAYQGHIFKIQETFIFVKEFEDEFIDFIRTNPGTLFDVKFSHSRIPYIRQHESIDAVLGKNLIKHFFPHPSITRMVYKESIKLSTSDFINSLNRYQEEAVRKILNNSSHTAPYIVFGPPGTGKTLTIVEAILQIRRHYPKRKILVSAPSNTACDMITQKLIQGMHEIPRLNLIRIHTDIRDASSVPKNIHQFSNISEDQIYKLPLGQIKNFNIIIVTLIHSGKYRKSFNPDYVFIDEAAQAHESEVAVAISTLSEPKQVILAGDPRQLGPIAMSKVADKYGYNISMIDRLMSTSPLYKNFNENFIMMLEFNYRSHENIIKIPNECFYEGKLKAVSEDAQSDPVSTINIHPIMCGYGKANMNGSAVEFCAVLAKEQKEGRSPSYFNFKEVEVVERYVKALFSLNETIKESDIGIITPYMRQVFKIKDALKNYPLIEVGTTEAFQGREKRVIIISTVRGQHSLLLYDRKYNLGFVGDKRRFNVAVTRAISKLIVIGNPYVLATSEYWLRIIEYCETNKTYYGSQYFRRDINTTDNIIGRFKKIPTLK